MDQTGAVNAGTRESRGQRYYDLSALSSGYRLTVIARFCDFQVSKYLQFSDYDVKNVNDIEENATYTELELCAVRANDVALELLQITPVDSFTKVQRINISNRILQQLVNRKFGIGMIAEALHLLTNLVRMPSSSMMILKKPTWVSDSSTSQDTGSGVITLFAIARWLDDLGAEVDVPFSAVTELKHLAVAILQSVHYPLLQCSTDQNTIGT